MPYLKSTSFETGVNAKYNNLIEGEDNYTNWSGQLSYFSLAFPLANPINDLLDRVERKYDLGMAFSVQPFSTVGYNIFSVEDSDGIEVQREYLGNGGTYAAQWGTGIKIKDFSAGINLGYLFGKVSTFRTVKFNELANSFDNYESINSYLNGFIWNLGVQYDYVLNQSELDEDKTASKKTITIGAYGNPGTNFKTSNDQEYLLIRTSTNAVTQIDTLSYLSDQAGTGKLPAKFGAGFMINNTLNSGEDKWGFGVNYESQLWSNYENSFNPSTLNNSSRISAGGFFRPDPKSLTNYLKRLYYQAGIFYKKDPAIIQGQDLTDLGMTFGIGMPFISQRKLSNANLGATLGIRGQDTAIEERYLQLNFGFTFNSNEWFLKRKYK